MASREWEIEQLLSGLARKIIAKEHTPQEFAEYQHLTAERGNLMRPRRQRRRHGLCLRLQQRLQSLS